MPKQPTTREDNQTGVITRTETKTKKPSLYKDPNDPTFVSMIASVCNG